MPAAPCSTASAASSAVRMPLTTSGSFATERSQSSASQVSDGIEVRASVCAARADIPGASGRAVLAAGKVRHVQVRRQPEAVALVALAPAKDGRIHRQHQGAIPGGLRAAHERLGDGAIPVDVELEPERPGRAAPPPPGVVVASVLTAISVPASPAGARRRQLAFVGTPAVGRPSAGP